MAVLTVEPKETRSETAVLGELSPGSVFRLYCETYLKTGDRLTNGEMQVIRLSGEYMTFAFPYKTLVTPVKSATLTVEE